MRSGICIYHRNCYWYPHLQLPRTPTSKRTSRKQPKGAHAQQHRGGVRYYEISGASTTALEERQDRHPTNAASSKASEKRVNTTQLLLTFDSSEWTGIPQKYTHPSTYDSQHTSVMYKWLLSSHVQHLCLLLCLAGQQVF